MGEISDSLVDGALRIQQHTEPIDLTKARKHHRHYVEQMSKIVNGNVVQVCYAVYVASPTQLWWGLTVNHVINT